MPQLNGVSTLGRQVIRSGIPSGTTDISLMLTTASQGRNYQYKCFVSLEETGYGFSLQLEGRSVWWEGVQFFFPSGLAFPVDVVGYWHFSGVSWRLIWN